MKKYVIFMALFLVGNFMHAQMPFFQGHRGCRGLFPENTLPAFQKALELGMVLEMDVCISKDNQVVVSHEPYMNSLYCVHPDGKKVSKEEEKSLNLYQMNYAQIKSFDTGINGNPLFPHQEKISTYKPLLSEVLELAEAYRKKTGKPVYYNIEIKSDSAEYGISQPKNTKEFCDLVYKTIENKTDLKFVTLQSFDFKILKMWHKKTVKGKYNSCLLSALVSRKTPDKVILDLGFIPQIYSPDYRSLSPFELKNCHHLGMKAIPWTVNDVMQMEELIRMGVDGIITDYPNLASNLKE